ncbi:hypothetical protein BOX15_Mlig033478g2 [Macrostomum lignano]|uniref:Hexosyltransferase n=1 Tax=Macrostomum lignano TaxID=282301 RepID=A0A267FK05_9PLAT|nr:hypothetical protein BOX15_Mlig033478g2 [Macrostomum lignano]
MRVEGSRRAPGGTLYDRNYSAIDRLGGTALPGLMWRLRRAGRICSAICHRASNRLKSPDCLLCIFTCTFVYVLCFIFILAIVVRSGGYGSGSNKHSMLFRMKDASAEAANAAVESAGLADSDDATGGGAGAGAGAGSSMGGGSGNGEVLYERKSLDDVFVEENVFNESPGGDAGSDGQRSEHQLDPEVLTETGSFAGYGSQDFRYPLSVDMPELLARLRSDLPVSVSPINQFSSPWLIQHSGECNRTAGGQPTELLVLVKSHPANLANREAIRRTWARPDCWRQRVRVYFLLGAEAAYGVRRRRRILRRVRDWRQSLLDEDSRHGDLLVREFVDHYFNNTLKLMSGIQWSDSECPGARFTAFVDDDFFVNPYQVERQLNSVSAAVYGRFLGGYVWRTSLPRRRSRKHRSKWDISVSEYPWSSYPPYVAAGALFMSRPVLEDIAVAMLYTRYLRFDDIFIGLVAHKLLLSPLHMESVRAYEPVWSNSTDTQALLRLAASHGYKAPSELDKMWQRLHLAGLCTAAAVRTAGAG